MKRAKFCKKYIDGDAGFSFIEIAVALIIIGMLAGAGLLLLGKTVESTQRKETVQRLLDAKSALLLFAENQGKLPNETGGVTYYRKIGSTPVDVWQNLIKYTVSPNVNMDVLRQYDICRRSRNPGVNYPASTLGGVNYPAWTSGGYSTSWIALNDLIKGTNYDTTGTGGKAVVALLLSGGARDADGLGNFFDGGNAGTTYVRKYPTEDFDDIIVAITADELYGAIRDDFCTATVEVTDTRIIPPLGGIYYVYNKTVDPLKPIGSANEGTQVKVLALIGDEIEIKNATATLNFTVGSNITKKTLATVADTRPLPLPIPPINPIMTVNIVDLP